MFTQKNQKRKILLPLMSLQTCRTFFLLQNIKYSDFLKNSGNNILVAMDKKITCRHFSKYLLLCSTEKRKYGITLGGVNERIDIFLGELSLLHDWQFLITSEYQVRPTPSVFTHTQQIFRMNETGEGHIKRVCATEQIKHKSALLLGPGSPYTLPLAPLIFMWKVCQMDREQDLRSWNACPCSCWYDSAQGQAISETQTKTFNS